MRRMRLGGILGWMTLSFAVLLPFQNCGSGFQVEGAGKTVAASSGTGAPTSTIDDINIPKEVKPALLCGEDGYNYLRRNYINKNCAACHDDKALAYPLFGRSDSSLAFQTAKGITDEKWHKTTTENAFCYPNCNLSTSGQMYKAIQEWLKNRNCP